MKRPNRAGRVLARCTGCGGEATADGAGGARTIAHTSDCTRRAPQLGDRARVSSGNLMFRNEEVCFDPKKPGDPYPWRTLWTLSGESFWFRTDEVTRDGGDTP